MSTVPQPQLVTIRSRSPAARIFLRSPILSDSFSFTARAHDPLCTAFLPHIANPKNPITVASNEKQIQSWRAESGVGGYFLSIIWLPEVRNEQAAAGLVPKEGEEENDIWQTIGDTGLGPLDLTAKTGETGLMLNSGPMTRRKGYAVETLDMIFAFGFDHLGLERIKFGTHEDNVAMHGLLEKKFGIPARWKEESKDWAFEVTPQWWKTRQDAAGESRVVVDVEPLDEEKK
jgi:RimJ/RimL family protein N-acetyltransferase